METFPDMDICMEIRDRFYSMGYGKTPLARIPLENGSEVLAKLEWFNPSGSIKSRAAFFMVMERLLKDDSNRNRIFVEGTSGNTGIAVAEVCATLGIRSRIIIPPGTMPETVAKLRETGTELIITDEECGVTSTDKAIEMAISMSRNDPEKYVSLHQHANPMNWKAHLFTTGPEIKKALGTSVDFVAVAMGTGGSVIGLSRYFRESDGSENIMLQADDTSYIQGIRNYNKARDKKIISENLSWIDSVQTVSAVDASEGVRELIHDYGIMPGFSSGSNFSAARRIALNYPGSRVLTVFPDSAEKYVALYEKLGICSKDVLMNRDFREIKSIRGTARII